MDIETVVAKVRSRNDSERRDAERDFLLRAAEAGMPGYGSSAHALLISSFDRACLADISKAFSQAAKDDYEADLRA